jgi:endo-1,4-beta-D-glucanase Y
MPGVALEVIVRASPRGWVPDWVAVVPPARFAQDPVQGGAGSYDAIRTYMWAGMLDAGDPARALLVKTFAPMVAHVQRHGTPPERAGSRDGALDGVGPAGFSAALLPLLAAAGAGQALVQQRQRVQARAPFERSDNYYEQALALFGQGWDDKRFRFARDGRLIVGWPCGAR